MFIVYYKNVQRILKIVQRVLKKCSSSKRCRFINEQKNKRKKKVKKNKPEENLKRTERKRKRKEKKNTCGTF